MNDNYSENSSCLHPCNRPHFERLAFRMPCAKLRQAIRAQSEADEQHRTGTRLFAQIVVSWPRLWQITPSSDKADRAWVGHYNEICRTALLPHRNIRSQVPGVGKRRKNAIGAEFRPFSIRLFSREDISTTSDGRGLQLNRATKLANNTTSCVLIAGEQPRFCALLTQCHY